MRHQVAGRKLGRTTSHRIAMFRNMVTSLLGKERIRTTRQKAKEVRRIAERMITLGKRGDLHARRQAFAYIRDKAVVHKLFEDLSRRYAQRPGGYTRILHLSPRPGDNADMAYLELVERGGKEAKAASSKAGESKSGRARKLSDRIKGRAKKSKRKTEPNEEAAPEGGGDEEQA